MLELTPYFTMPLSNLWKHYKVIYLLTYISKPYWEDWQLTLKLHHSHKGSTIESPCIRDCCLNDQDICQRCFRLPDEITGWPYYDDTEKQAVLDQAAQRKNVYNKTLI